MQGQAVVQMANQLPLNPVVKSGANSKNAVTTKSNSSFANEFKNAADNIVDSNATENIEGNVVQDNTQSILSALATFSICKNNSKYFIFLFANIIAVSFIYFLFSSYK